MIKYVKGNLLEAKVEALVNTVNTVGVMGKGIALQFKEAFPKNFKAYAKASKLGKVELGKIFVYELAELDGPRFIVNFPTKKHWRGKARLEDIEKGLQDLISFVRKENIRSVAIPPLGCGSGGLEWCAVQQLIERAFKKVSGVQVLVYPPQESPQAREMKVATNRPPWRTHRAAFILALARYLASGLELTRIEIQKLAYFLQCAGEEMKLEFSKGKYGPYAEKLNFVLQNFEGHFIRGYGDRTANTYVTVLADAVREAREILESNDEARIRLEQVSKLIDGFESPYGLELLGTVHWIATKEDPQARSDVNAAINDVQRWSSLKKLKFQPSHIQIAWQRLKEQGWFEHTI